MVACTANMVDSVQLLRKYNARYDIYDKGGCTAIHWAVDSRSVKLLDWMASDNADFNVRDRGNGGWSPLIRCGKGGESCHGFLSSGGSAGVNLSLDGN